MMPKITPDDISAAHVHARTHAAFGRPHPQSRAERREEWRRQRRAAVVDRVVGRFIATDIPTDPLPPRDEVAGMVGGFGISWLLLVIQYGPLVRQVIRFLVDRWYTRQLPRL